MKKIITAFALVLSLSFTSCKSYFDINVDPNAPSEEALTTSLMLPAVEMSLAASYGDYLRITGGYFAQQYAQYFGTSNYLDYSKFTMSSTRSDGTYTQLYQKCILNSYSVSEKAIAENDFGTNLAATVLRVYAYQALVDCYGEVPYSEAIDASNLTPKYDEGKDVYAGILNELDEALALATPSMSVAKNFLFPNQSASCWIEFANALKLRILMRESKKVDVKSQLQALIAEDNFPVADVAFEGCWAEAAGKESPFWAEEFSTLGGSTQKNVVANIALVGTMQQPGYTDGRLAAFFNPNKSGNFTGAVSGTNFSKSKSFKADYWCQPVASYDMPVYLMTLSEIEFFKAEYEARYGTAAKAKAAYEEAIKASFESAGADGADACIAKFPFDDGNYEKCIGLQKWLALSGTDPFEAYCELRRLGYPEMSNVKGDDFYYDL